jgi:glycosyltransferase involved in cell wall biosynthesis
MIHNRNIVALASNWHFDPTGKHHLMRILSEQNNVLWVNYHASRCPQISGADLRWALRKIGQWVRGPETVTPSLHVLTPLVLPLPGSSAATFINRVILTAQIRSALRRFPAQPVQLWSFAPDVDYLVGRLREELALYYCVDEFAEFTGYDAVMVRAAEERLMNKADVVITSARDLYESRQHRHANVHMVAHGVDVDHFSSAASCNPPEFCRTLTGPIIGFFGMIQDWVDVDLIAAVARQRPDWNFVFVGRQAVDVSPISVLPNVHLPGPVDYAELPAWCAAFDVATIPFKINRLTQHVNPIKLREYLAAGLAVVSTDLPEVRAYQPHVRIANGPEAFEVACREALADRSPVARASRQAAVHDESWAARVDSVCEHVEATLASSIHPHHGMTPAVAVR